MAAVILLQSKLRNALDILQAAPDQKSVMTTMVELRWYEALVLYKYHFFGFSNSRDCLVDSIRRYTGLLRNSLVVLGTRHPINRRIIASLRLCFDEQLDWSVDDIPAELLVVRPLLDDVPPDIADRLGDIDDDILVSRL